MEHSPAPRSELLYSRLRQAQAETKRRSSTTLPVQAVDDLELPLLTREDEDGEDLCGFNHTHQAPIAIPETRNLSISVLSNPDNHRRSTGRRASQLIHQSMTPQDMGVREIEEHVSKLAKLNFDLKLEVYHRREKVEELERKVHLLEESLEKSLKEKVELRSENGRLRSDNKDLLDMNEELLGELETRDKAVDEAVDLICSLEERVDTLLQQERIVTIDEAFANVEMLQQEQDFKAGFSLHGSSPIPTHQGLLKEPKRPPSFLLDDNVETAVLKRAYFDKSPSLQRLRSYASLLPRQEHDFRNGSLASHSLADLSDLGASSSLPLNHSSPTPAFRDGSPPSNQIRATRTWETRTNRWIVDCALCPTAHAAAHESFGSGDADLGSRDTGVQEGCRRELSPRLQTRSDVSLRALFLDEAARGNITRATEQSGPLSTPGTMPPRTLRHASPSIRRGERGLPETPLSRSKTNSSSTLSYDSPISNGGYISKLDSILPYDVAFYYDGSGLDTYAVHGRPQNTEKKYTLSYTKEKQFNDHGMSRNESMDRSQEPVLETPVRGGSIISQVNHNTQQSSPNHHIARSAPRPTYTMMKLQSEPITPTLRQYENIPAIEPTVRRAHFESEVRQLSNDIRANGRIIKISASSSTGFPTPPRRTLSLRRHSPAQHRGRSASSSGILLIPASEHPHHRNIQNESPPLQATVTTLTMTSPQLSAATERAIHSSISTPSGPSRSSTVSGTSWSKVETPSDGSGVRVATSSPTVVMEKERKRPSRSSSLVRRFSLRRADSGQGKVVHGGSSMERMGGTLWL